MGTLTALKAKNAKPGRHGDGDGLYLLVKPTGGRSWMLRIQRDGKRQDIGLGAVDFSSRTSAERRLTDDLPILLRRNLTLQEARDKAAELRRFARAGRDPIEERDRERKKVPNFKEAAEAAHTALASGWGDKGAAAFLSSLAEHTFDLLGKKRVDRIEAADIQDVLRPIWLTIPVMARKVRQRIGTVLDFAKSKGWRLAEPPGRSVAVGLPRQPKGGNFKAMPYSDLPAFVAGLRAAAPTTGRTALLFQILTAARPGEVRGARWEQIDEGNRNWNRPSELMKGAHSPSHTVTLNSVALALLKRLGSERTHRPDDLLFPGSGGAAMSDMTLNKLLRDAGLSYDAHGFRSSFRDWAAEKMPEIPDPVAEAALAHTVPDKVVAAYKRTKFVEMRRQLLDAWGNYLSDSLPKIPT